MRRLILLSQSKPNLRLPELASLNNNIRQGSLDKRSPEKSVIIQKLNSTEVTFLSNRAISIQKIYNLHAEAENYDDLFKKLSKVDLSRYYEESMRLETVRVNKKSKPSSKVNFEKLFNNHPKLFDKINLNTPENKFAFVEEYCKNSKNLSSVYFAEEISKGIRSKLLKKYSLSKRRYLENTTLDPETAFYLSNLARIKPGDVVYDPFMGSGSTLISAAEFGALVIGSDISYRVVNGIGKCVTGERSGRNDENSKNNLESQMAEYGLSNNFLGTMTMDMRTSCFAREEFLDAVITDPPFGLSQKPLTIGKRKEKPFVIEKRNYSKWLRDLPDDEIKSMQKKYPETVEYQLDELFTDLLIFCSRALKVGGRLCFEMPYDKHKIKGEDLLVGVNNSEICNLELVYNFDTEKVRDSMVRRLFIFEKVCGSSDVSNKYDKT